jgi:hypothetical protein
VTEGVCRKSHTVTRALGASLVPRRMRSNAIYFGFFKRRSSRSGLNIIFGLNIIWRADDVRAEVSLPQLPLIENEHCDDQQRIRGRMSRDGFSEFVGADRKKPVGRTGQDAWNE